VTLNEETLFFGKYFAQILALYILHLMLSHYKTTTSCLCKRGKEILFILFIFSCELGRILFADFGKDDYIEQRMIDF